MEKEFFIDVKGFESEYKISSYGKVISKSRLKSIGNKTEYISKEIELKQNKNNKGYFCVTLSKNGKVKKIQIHQLIAICFHGHIPCGHLVVVDHFDNDKENNYYKNIRLVSQRENASKDRVEGSSEFVGVYWYKPNNKWTAKIMINKKRYYLGLFDSESDANVFYKKALELKDFEGKVKNFRLFVKSKII